MISASGVKRSPEHARGSVSETERVGNVTITDCPAGKIPHRGRVAQLAEQLTLNQ